MTESAKNRTRTIKDDGKRLRFMDKSVRGEGTAAIYTRAPQLFDHFVESTVVGTTYGKTGAAVGTGSKFTSTQTGTGTGTVLVSSTASGGIISVATTASGAVQSMEFAGTNIFWEPEELASGQEMVFEARVRLATLTTVQAFWGFAPAVTVGGDIIDVSTASVTTVGTDNALGFLYSSIPTSGALDQSGTTTNYFGVTSAVTGTTTTYTASTAVPGDAVFHIYRIAVNAAGDARFSVDDTTVGSVGYAAASGQGLNPAVAYTPFFSVITTASAARTLEIDWVLVHTTMETGV